MPSTINWHEKELWVLIGRASDEVLHSLAIRILGEAIPDVRRDTGFLANSGYVNSPLDQGFKAKRERRRNREGYTANYETAEQPAGEDGQTVVGFAANYAVYVEARYPFLYPASRTVANEVGGIVEQVGKKHFG